MPAYDCPDAVVGGWCSFALRRQRKKRETVKRREEWRWSLHSARGFELWPVLDCAGSTFDALGWLGAWFCTRVRERPLLLCPAVPAGDKLKGAIEEPLEDESGRLLDTKEKGPARCTSIAPLPRKQRHFDHRSQNPLWT